MHLPDHRTQWHSRGFESVGKIIKIFLYQVGKGLRNEDDL